MLIMSKKTGIVYKNICLEKRDENGLSSREIHDTENMSEIDFNEYEFGYTRLCDSCAEIAGKDVGCEGTYCFNHNCNCRNDDSIYIGEVTFIRDEIMNDLVVYNE